MAVLDSPEGLWYVADLHPRTASVEAKTSHQALLWDTDRCHTATGERFLDTLRLKVCLKCKLEWVWKYQGW